MDGVLFDPGVNIWLQGFSSPFLDRFMGLVTSLGTAAFYMLIIPAVYWCIDRRQGHNLMFLFLTSMWINGFAKEWFGLPRPAAAQGVRVLVHETSPGFPSGHAQGAMTLWGYLGWQYRGRRAAWTAAAFLIFLIGLSRLYLGAHFLGDVLGGYGIGLVLLAVFVTGFRQGWGGSWPRSVKLVLAVAVPLALYAISRRSGDEQVLGFLLGLLVTDLYALEKLDYSPRAPLWAQLVKGLLGIAVFVPLYVLRRTLLPGGWAALFGYAVLSAWVTLGAPWVFLRLGLARPERAG
ncbi:MAG TPA: phosphatase PAP2 family protein [Firmicutes bacterium]|nr:phosphatase PAP2 family protein [Bacillota bacterium]